MISANQARLDTELSLLSNHKETLDHIDKTIKEATQKCESSCQVSLKSLYMLDILKIKNYLRSEGYEVTLGVGDNNGLLFIDWL